VSPHVHSKFRLLPIHVGAQLGAVGFDPPLRVRRFLHHFRSVVFVSCMWPGRRRRRRRLVASACCATCVAQMLRSFAMGSGSLHMAIPTVRATQAHSRALAVAFCFDVVDFSFRLGHASIDLPTGEDGGAPIPSRLTTPAISTSDPRPNLPCTCLCASVARLPLCGRAQTGASVLGFAEHA
jgi:hypothetical protein